MPKEDTQFKPGNKMSKGRPKGSVSLVSALKKRLRENPDEKEKIIDALIRDAQVGDSGDKKLVLEYIDGRPAQVIINKDDRHEKQFDTSKFSDQELEQWMALMDKATDNSIEDIED